MPIEGERKTHLASAKIAGDRDGGAMLEDYEIVGIFGAVYEVNE